MDIKETREEIIKRSNAIKQKRIRRIKGALEGVSVALIGLLIMIVQQIPYTGDAQMGSSYYGTLLQGRDVGMYIIVGLICFLLGVIITLITVKFRSHDDTKDDRTEDK